MGRIYEGLQVYCFITCPVYRCTNFDVKLSLFRHLRAPQRQYEAVAYIVWCTLHKEIVLFSMQMTMCVMPVAQLFRASVDSLHGKRNVRQQSFESTCSFWCRRSPPAHLFKFSFVFITAAGNNAFSKKVSHSHVQFQEEDLIFEKRRRRSLIGVNVSKVEHGFAWFACTLVQSRSISSHCDWAHVTSVFDASFNRWRDDANNENAARDAWHRPHDRALYWKRNSSTIDAKHESYAEQFF